MERKVEIFSDDNRDDLENCLNRWFSVRQNIKNVQISGSNSEYMTPSGALGRYYCVYVYYEVD